VDLTARWILFDIPPGSKPPCLARIGFMSTSGDFKVLGDVTVAECLNVPDGLAKCRAVIDELGLALSDPFDLIYPRYAVEGPLELEMHQLAWVIKEEADRQGYGFEREIPAASF
jgi:hypothetical protein